MQSKRKRKIGVVRKIIISLFNRTWIVFCLIHFNGFSKIAPFKLRSLKIFTAKLDNEYVYLNSNGLLSFLLRKRAFLVHMEARKRPRWRLARLMA